MQVTVLGTGIMGAGMARSLAREGHEVTVWNRTRDRADALADDGIDVAGEAQEAVAVAEVVVTMLFDAEAVLDVVEQLALPEGCVWVQASTIGLEGTRRVTALAQQRGLALVDAPVLGTRQPAEQGALVVLASGAPDAVARVQPVFDAVGRKTVHVGDRPGAATALKLVGNAWIGSITAALAQSVALAEGLGLDPQLFLDAIEGGPVDTPYAHAKAAAMLAADYPTAFAVDGVVKDLGLIRDALGEAGVPDDLVATVRGLFASTSSAGRGGDDMAAVREAFRPADR